MEKLGLSMSAIKPKADGPVCDKVSSIEKKLRHRLKIIQS